MKPMFRKELRQCLKWAAAVLALMCLAVIYLAWEVSRPGMYLAPFERFQQLSMVACPLAGLFLGVMHVVTEKRRDLWAFLVHRPVSRTTILLAKASAGMVLYVAAVGVPLAAADAWLAIPGNVPAPYYWPMVLPGFADVLTGAVYYLAGLLIAMREARWYGSRVLPLGVAVICSVVVVSVWHFWVALLAIIAAAAVLAVAAWGSFVGGGQYGPQPPAARAALGASLLAGIAVVYVIGGVVLTTLAATALPQGASYQIARDGEVVLVVQDRWGRVVEITNLDGTRNTPLEQAVQQADSWRWPFLRTDTVLVPGESEPDPTRTHRYRAPETFYLRIGKDGPTSWLYSFPERLVLLFDTEQDTLVGRLGPAGFKAPPDPPMQRFGEDVVSAAWRWLAFKEVVYGLDLRDRTIRTLLAPQGDRVLTVGGMFARAYDELVVVTDRTIRFMTLGGDVLLAADVEHDLALYGHLQFAAIDDPRRFYVWYGPRYWRLIENPDVPSHLIVYDADGAIVARHELPALPRPQSSATWDDVALGLTMPLAAMGAEFVAALAQGESPFDPGSPVNTYVLVVLVPLMGIACAIVTARLARRFAFPRGRRRGWIALNFLVGPAGLALLWGLRDWPGRVPCAACGKRRVTTRDRCEHCDAPFPPPAPDGTEIFE